ncbi:MAG TPA: crotonase/enoyl-CoA hydratase family protein [Polyangiaceae bacterium]|jgi:enoyl-CoA hydratase
MPTSPLPSLASLAVSVDSHVATVVLRSNGKANRMGPAFWAEMPVAFAWLDAEPEVRAVVLRGEGEHFSYGLDLATMGGALGAVLGDGAMARERTELLATIERLQRAVSCVAACRKPVVAAIAGWCIGGGVDLATACDVRLCAADARFSVREVKLAMVADVGTLARLPAIVGQGHARMLAMTGDDVDAARALRIGLVEDVYESHEALFEAAGALAGRLAANPPLVVQGVKHVLGAASERAAAESLRTVALWNAAFLASHDLREAMTAFLEKRPARFEGR